MANDKRDVEIRVKATEETAGVFAKVREEMEQLKKAGGRTSPLGEFAETLKGAGVAFGISELGKTLGEAAGKASELREQFVKGEISLREMRWQLAEEIPVFGQMVSAGHAINEWWTGIDAELKSAREEAQRLDDVILRQNESLREQNRLYAQQQLEIKAIQGQTALIGGRGLKGELDKSRESTKEQIDALKNQTQQSVDDEKTKSAARLLQLREEHEKMETTLGYISGERWRTNADKIQQKQLKTSLRENELQQKLESVTSKNRQDMLAAGDKDKIAALNAKESAEEKEINRKDALERENAEKEAAARVRDIRAKANQERLRDLGNELGAELDEINAGVTAQITAIDRAAADAKEKNPERAADIDRQAAAEKAAVQEEAGVRKIAAARKNANDQKDKEFQVESEAASARIESLRAEAEMGSTAKQIELDRAEIAEKFRQKREEITKQLREDLTLTQQQRQILQQTLGGLDAEEKREEKIAAIKRASKFELAQSNSDHDVSGVALAFKAKLSDDLANKLKDADASGPGGAGVGAAWHGGAGGAGGKSGAAAEQTAANTQKSTDLLSQLLQSFNQNFQQLIQQIGQGNGTAQPIFLN